jgi:hypothetical protein
VFFSLLAFFSLSLALSPSRDYTGCVDNWVGGARVGVVVALVWVLLWVGGWVGEAVVL